ncbi:MAG TPA: nuclear transport factor 2 family protein [Dehalococcoidia bacterium]|jgi:ketosteroid isomerase-like protein|nr:nuclear transport factor 2 family protein [Dehalococcoidia bacterium]
MPADLLAANAAFYAAFNAGDVGAMDALWARSAPVACVHPGWNALAGREQVMESWRGILANAEQPRVFVGAESAHELGDVGYVLCREIVGGGALATTNVFALEDDEWRMVHHHTSPVAI